MEAEQTNKQCRPASAPTTDGDCCSHRPCLWSTALPGRPCRCLAAFTCIACVASIMHSLIKAQDSGLQRIACNCGPLERQSGTKIICLCLLAAPSAWGLTSPMCQSSRLLTQMTRRGESFLRQSISFLETLDPDEDLCVGKF